MIGRLVGKIMEKTPPMLLIDVNGVGYEVAAPMSTFYRLPELGQAVTLHTHLVVREDAQLLYGFSQLQERVMFRTLIKVNNVGPKLALAILSGIEPQEFARCIMENDTASLVRLPGVGKKTAERLIVEMRDRLKDEEIKAILPDQHAATGVPIKTSVTQEAVNALIALGYKPQEASRLVAKVEGDEMTVEDIIKAALKELAI